METTDLRAGISIPLERALRRASQWHDGQSRKGSPTPYIAHPFGVALILDRHGFAEPVVIAGLLHDVVEDTEATLEDVRREFGEEVANLVAHCSEVKTDATGRKRPWADRKRDHLEALAEAPTEARAVVLADKLHNLTSMACDLEAGRPVWPLFNAGREDVLAYYRASLDRLGHGERLAGLAAVVRAMLESVGRFPVVEAG